MTSTELAIKRLSKGIKSEEKELVFRYFNTPPKERVSQKQFTSDAGIFRPVFYRLKQIYALEQAQMIEEVGKTENKLETIRTAQNRMYAEFNEEDPIGWWKQKTLELNEAILESAKRGNAQSQKLAKQLAGELTEKTEVTLALTADERAQRNLEADRQLGEAGYR